MHGCDVADHADSSTVLGVAVFPALVSKVIFDRKGPSFQHQTGWHLSRKTPRFRSKFAVPRGVVWIIMFSILCLACLRSVFLPIPSRGCRIGEASHPGPDLTMGATRTTLDDPDDMWQVGLELDQELGQIAEFWEFPPEEDYVSPPYTPDPVLSA